MSNPFAQNMNKLQIPEGMGTTITIDEFSVVADENRCIEVPTKYVKDLKAQGLTDYVAPAKKK
jgi:hypothetical protein